MQQQQTNPSVAAHLQHASTTPHSVHKEYGNHSIPQQQQMSPQQQPPQQSPTAYNLAQHHTSNVAPMAQHKGQVRNPTMSKVWSVVESSTFTSCILLNESFCIF